MYSKLNLVMSLSHKNENGDGGDFDSDHEPGSLGWLEDTIEVDPLPTDVDPPT